jgi:hypothetical protein
MFFTAGNIVNNGRRNDLLTFHLHFLKTLAICTDAFSRLDLGHFMFIL